MRKALVISLATGALVLAGCQRDEAAEADDVVEVETDAADAEADDAPAEADDSGEEAE